MFKRLFGLTTKRNNLIATRIYSEIVAAARQPFLYSEIGVPDTPLGRFEMLCLHMFLFLHRVRDLDGAPRDLAQHVTDVFFTDVDHSLRELGIGDIGIPRRVKKLARMFYGRAQAYGQAIDQNDPEAMAAALLRNVKPESTNWPGSPYLADWAFSAHRNLQGQTTAEILAGNVRLTR